MGGLSLLPKIPFPGNGDRYVQRPGSNIATAGSNPASDADATIHREVAESGHAHSVRQTPIDSRLDEVRCEEGKRDRHVNLPRGAVLTLGNAHRVRRGISDEFVEPAAASCN